MHKVAVIGGGASGMLSALVSSQNGNSVVLLEKNDKLGKKLYITGKGRCNLSNYTNNEEFLQNVISNSKFLYGAIRTFSPYDTYQFFENLGLKLKVERGNRVFPLSDKASDVTKILTENLIKNNVDIRLNTVVLCILVQNGKVVGVKTDNETIYCDSVIVCTGGISYHLTGSTGDGYKFAKSVGHSITEPKPALVGICLKGNDFVEMQGLSLKNVNLSCYNSQKKIYSEFGEMLFTHFGISGPIVLSCSSSINRLNFDDVYIEIDLKPALSVSTLDQRLINEFRDNNNKSIINIMPSLLPKSMGEIVLKRAQIVLDKKCSEISREERERLVKVLKGLTFKVAGLRSIEEAIITSGGVNVKEINPKTMQSKLCEGLYFAGEVIDVDALTGGFNLQIAFSTAFVAGTNA